MAFDDNPLDPLAVPPGRLFFLVRVHAVVRRLNEGFQGHSLLVLDHAAAEGYRGPGQFCRVLPYLGKDALAAGEGAVGQQDDELVAPVADKGIGGSDIAVNALREGADQLVPGGVPALVVYPLETVNVQKAQRQGGLLKIRRRQGPPHGRKPPVTVKSPGQGVLGRVKLHLPHQAEVFPQQAVPHQGDKGEACVTEDQKASVGCQVLRKGPRAQEYRRRKVRRRRGKGKDRHMDGGELEGSDYDKARHDEQGSGLDHRRGTLRRGDHERNRPRHGNHVQEHHDRPVQNPEPEEEPAGKTESRYRRA